ncbi:leiomodin-1 [Crotalus adamanteus]|uniref:Leiomodin-1 n=1 Tax=Crotalus adamanteus TaxID=8729 RepID=A0AAW1BT80_CROAD
MSKVAKYRRQVSEDPDIDNLLSTLSPEEMEELEKELDASDTDGSIPVDLEQRDKTDKQLSGKCSREETLSYSEKETKKFMPKEQSADEAKKKKEAKILEAKHKEPYSRDLKKSRTPELIKEGKKEEQVQKTNQKGKDETDSNSKMGQVKEKTGKDEKRFSREKEKSMAADKSVTGQVRGEERGKLLKSRSVEDKGTQERAAEHKKGTGWERKTEDKKECEKIGERRSALKPVSKREDKREPPKAGEISSTPKPGSKVDNEEKLLEDSKGIPETNVPILEQEDMTQEPPDSSPSKSADNSSSQSKEDEATSIFDEPLEKIKNDDPEMVEVNINNSDCINNEILVRFAEALEFNTVVKVFALANTRADDHVAFAIAIMLKSNKTLTSVNLDSNHITGKGILAIFRALLQNKTLTELRFHNQRHICGGKTEMEIAKLLKENTTLLKLGYHFELAGPRMTVTNLLSRNMDKQRQKRLQEQKQAQEKMEKKDFLEVPKAGCLSAGSPKISPKPSPKTSARSSPKAPPKKAGTPDAPPPPPPPLAPPPAPPLINENLRLSLSPATQRKMVEKALPPQEKNSRDQLLAAIRSSNKKQLKKVEVPKLLQYVWSYSTRLCFPERRKRGGRNSQEGPASLPTKTPNAWARLAGWSSRGIGCGGRGRGAGQRQPAGDRGLLSGRREVGLHPAGGRPAPELQAQLPDAQLLFGAALPPATPSSRTSDGGFGRNQRETGEDRNRWLGPRPPAHAIPPEGSQRLFCSARPLDT